MPEKTRRSSPASGRRVPESPDVERRVLRVTGTVQGVGFRPFVDCTDCGPRFTIVKGVPYDRGNTTMAPFRMCALCDAEYHDPASRFHARPNACPACGPRSSDPGRGAARSRSR